MTNHDHTTKHDREAFCIDALRNQNTELKMRVVELENTNTQWRSTNEALRRENNGLKQQLTELRLAGKFTNPPKVIAS